MTELHDAAQRARVNDVRRLLRAGANPNERDELGYRPIHLALVCRSAAQDRELQNRVAIVMELLDHGANADARDPERKSALWHALAMGPIGKRKGRRAVARMLRHKPDLRSRDSERYSILHMAAVYGYEDVVRRALRAKANPNARDEQGGTPLLHAAFHGWPAIAAVLLREGASPNAKSDEGRTPLHVASQAGQLAIVRMLVASGANVEAKDADGHTPIELAAWMRHGEIVRFLLGKKAHPRWALHLMAELRFSEGRREGHTSYGVIAKMLLAADADPNGKDASKKTALQRHMARKRPRMDVVRALLAAGARK